MLSVEMTSMPASSSCSTSCQRFSFARARGVGVGVLVDEHDLGPAGEDGVDVHLVQHRAAVLDLPARHHLEIADLVGGLRRPWVSTTPMTTSVPRSLRRTPSPSIL